MSRIGTAWVDVEGNFSPFERGVARVVGSHGKMARSVNTQERSIQASQRRTSSAVKRRAEESVAANALLTRSFRGMARSAVTAGVGFAGAYIGIAKAKEAVSATTELAHSTLRLHKATGLSIETASRYSAAAKVRGIQDKALAQVMGIVAKNVDAANQGGAKQIALFKRLGITQDDLKKKDLGGIVAQMADGFHHLGPGIDKTSTAMQLMGRGWQSLMPLMNQGSRGLREQLALADKYHVTLHGKTVKSLEELIQAQRETKFASLGVQVAFTQGIAPALIKGEQAAAKFLRVISDPHMTSDQKWHAIQGQIHHLVRQLDRFVEDEMPKIADTVAHEAPHVAGAFVKGFVHAGPMGQLFLGGWLIKRFGGWGAFAKIGRKGGALVGTGMAEGVQGEAAVGRFAKAGRFIGRTVGVAAAGYIGFEITKEITKRAGDALFGPQGILNPFGPPEDPRTRRLRHEGRKLKAHDIRTGVFRPEEGGGSRGNALRFVAAHFDDPQKDARRGARDLGKELGIKSIDQARRALDRYTKARHHNAVESSHNARLEHQYQLALGSSAAHMNTNGSRARKLGGDIHDLRARLSGLKKGTSEYNTTAEELRKKQKALHNPILNLRDDVHDLKDRLGHLRKGTQDYRDTAELLRRKQKQLNRAVEDAGPAARKGGRGLKGMGKNAGGLAGDVDSAAGTIAAATNKILNQLGAKPLHYHSVFGAHGAFSQKVRAGGRIFGGGGLVPIMAAGGELLVDGGQAAVIPGDPTRDGTPLLAPAGSAVLTWDGQARMMAGASLESAVATQRPHFRSGGRIPSAGGVPALISLGRELQREGFQVGENAAFGDPPDPGVHVQGSYHYRFGGRGALDVNHDQGGEDAALSALANRLRAAGWHYLWHVPHHFDHLHVDVAGGAGGSIGSTVELLKRLKWHGPGGSLRTIGQGTSDRMVKAANRYIQKQSPTETGGAGGNYSGPLNRTFPVNGSAALSSRQVQNLARRAGFPNPTLADHVAYAESTRHPGEVNSIGATGLMQILLSAHPDAGGSAAMRNPWKNMVYAHQLYRSAGGSWRDWEASRNAGAGGGWGRYARRGGFVGGRRRFVGGGRVRGERYRGSVGDRYYSRGYRSGVHDPRIGVVRTDLPVAGLSEDFTGGVEGAFAMQLALAALTPDTGDDAAILTRKIAFDREDLRIALAAGDTAAITRAATSLKSDQDTLTELTSAITDLTDQQAALKEELATYNKNFRSVEGIVQSEGIRAFSDVISGQLGGRIASRRATAGIGTVATA